MACPSGKIAHATYEAALAHQKNLVWKNHVSGEPEKSKGLNVYPCQHTVCGAWHVGHTDALVPLVYHYTIGLYLDKIIASGVLKPRHPLKPSEAFNEPNPLLWFSWNPEWDQSVTKDPRPSDRRFPPTGRAVTEIAGQGLIRWGALASVAKLRWNDYLDRNETPPLLRERMALRGNPVDWLATDQEVPLSECMAFEVFCHGRWVSGATLADGEFETYLADRTRAYNAAWKRLREKIIEEGPGGFALEAETNAEMVMFEDFAVCEREMLFLREHAAEFRRLYATQKPRKRKRKR